MENIVKVRFQCPNLTDAQWASKNPVLRNGEVAFSTDKRRYKIGDGTAKWSALQYNDASRADVATKVASALTIQGNGTTLGTFDGSGAKTVNITPANVGAAPASHGVHVAWPTVVPKAPGTAAMGTSAKVAREDHVHPVQVNISGNSGTATRLQTDRNITIGNTKRVFNGTADIAWTLADIGAAAASHGTHVTWATTAPKANGTAAVGTVARVAREDHVHPLQTSVSGNSGTTTKLATARAIKIGNTSKNFDGTANVTWTLAEIGASASGHTHDDRYFTESEMNTKLAAKADKTDLLTCMRMYGGTALDSKGTTTDANAQYKIISLSTATVNASAFSKVLTDLPKGKYSVMVRMKISAKTATTNVIKIQCGDTSALKTFYVKPSMFSAANAYQTFGFTVDHTTTSFTANMSIGTALSGVTVGVDYLAIAPTFTAISSVA